MLARRKSQLRGATRRASHGPVRTATLWRFANRDARIDRAPRSQSAKLGRCRQLRRASWRRTPRCLCGPALTAVGRSCRHQPLAVRPRGHCGRTMVASPHGARRSPGSSSCRAQCPGSGLSVGTVCPGMAGAAMGHHHRRRSRCRRRRPMAPGPAHHLVCRRFRGTARDDGRRCSLVHTPTRSAAMDHGGALGGKARSRATPRAPAVCRQGCTRRSGRPPVRGLGWTGRGSTLAVRAARGIAVAAGCPAVRESARRPLQVAIERPRPRVCQKPPVWQTPERSRAAQTYATPR